MGVFDEFDQVKAMIQCVQECVIVSKWHFDGVKKILYVFVRCHRLSRDLSLSRPRESCFLTASSVLLEIVAISFTE